jgi:3-hydroxyisobutyrate dehydrogenase-like beta-hydroxyacid dehydrogenase
MAERADATRVAFMGLGIMGLPMAGNLARAGFDLTVWNRTAAKAEELAAEHGAKVAPTPADAAREADVAITMLPDVPEVEAVLFGDQAAAAGLAEGSMCVDMSTIAPAASRAIGERLGERGVAFLDAPVTGSRPKAEDGTLTIMAGGEAEDFERALPLFEAMGDLAVHIGPRGHGSMAKLINNTLAAVNAAALAEGLVMARATGVDTDALLRVVAAGAGASAMLDLKARPMLSGDFEPLFKLEHMLKDVRYCLEAAAEAGVERSVAEAAERLYARAAEDGRGGQDFAAVVTAVG